MKCSNLKYLALAFLTVIISCSKEDPAEPLKGAINFSIHLEDNLKSATSFDSEDDIKSIYISIKDADQNLIYNLQKLPLIKIGAGYVTAQIELLAGKYTVEDFIVVNSVDSAIYLTPKVNSEFEDLVSNPLPVEFVVSGNNVTSLSLEVIPANLGDPVLYGYAIFSFEIVNTLEKGLLFHLPFNDSIFDASGNDIDVSNNSVSLTTDMLSENSHAGYFDGFSSYLEINNNSPIIEGSEFSVAAWFKLNGPGGGNTGNTLFVQRDDEAASNKSLIICYADNLGDRTVAVRSSNGEMVVLSSPILDYEGWHHYAATLSADDSLRLYIDHKLVGAKYFSQSGDFNTSIDYVFVGQHKFSGIITNNFNGAIDDFRIYNRALTSREIYELYISK